MTNFEKLKKANEAKYREFIFNGQAFWLKHPTPAESQRKMKELKVLKNVGESGGIQVNVNESMPFQRWSFIAMLHSKTETGFERMFTDEQTEEAYALLENDFVKAVTDFMKPLEPETKNE